MASLHHLQEFLNSEQFQKWLRELIELVKEPYFLPSVIVSVTVAILITYFQENKHVAHGAAMEECEDALDGDYTTAAPSANDAAAKENNHHGDDKAGDSKPAKKAFALPST